MNTKRKIVVNTRFLIKDKLEGIGYFTLETLKHITPSHPEVDFIFLFDRPYAPEFIFSENIKPVVLFPPARHPFLWYCWFEFSVANYLEKTKPDLFLSLDGYCSLRAETPTVTVIHDLAFEHFPEHVPFLVRKYYQYFVPKFAKHATRIATVSEYSKQDISEKYTIEQSKIDVVYSAAKENFAPTEISIQKVIKEKYTQGKDYLLYVGAIHPRKNVGNMLLAFDQFKSQTNSNMKFLLAGALGWQNEEVQTIYENMKHKTDVLFTGRQPLDELTRIIGSAFAVLYVSLFEGFGVPPLEAMKCGVPVITSTTSSMPEVCGDGALLANPASVNQITEAITKLSSDDNLRTSLIEKGILQAQKFTWENTASLLWESCEKVMNQRT
jgi:glycosyltransferase involved in cell wall biosynthesis